MIMLVIRSGLSSRHRAFAAFAAASILMAVASSVMAQPNASKGAPNALQGFSQNRGQPVQIEAAALEVRDKDKVATFSGNVKVVQGDTTMRCKSLVVFYEQQGQPSGAPAMKAAAPGPGGSSQISRLEATGGVTVNQKDQTATGDKALFDMKANTVTLKGNVVVSQGQNVMRGDQLVVNLTTGVSQVIAGPSSQVRVLMQPSGSSPDGKPGSGLGSSQGTSPGLGPKFGPSFGPPKQNSSN
jgi:lipopolysaccharide export system protein LptA